MRRRKSQGDTPVHCNPRLCIGSASTSVSHCVFERVYTASCEDCFIRIPLGSKYFFLVNPSLPICANKKFTPQGFFCPITCPGRSRRLILHLQRSQPMCSFVEVDCVFPNAAACGRRNPHDQFHLRLSYSP
jgi:hypothetical protein